MLGLLITNGLLVSVDVLFEYATPSVSSTFKLSVNVGVNGATGVARVYTNPELALNVNVASPLLSDNTVGSFAGNPL